MKINHLRDNSTLCTRWEVQRVTNTVNTCDVWYEMSPFTKNIITVLITRPMRDLKTVTLRCAACPVVSCYSHYTCSASCCSPSAPDPLLRRPTVGGSPATGDAIDPASGGCGPASAGPAVPCKYQRLVHSRRAARCPPGPAPSPTPLSHSCNDMSFCDVVYNYTKYDIIIICKNLSALKFYIHNSYYFIGNKLIYYITRKFEN